MGAGEPKEGLENVVTGEKGGTEEIGAVSCRGESELKLLRGSTGGE